MSHSSKLTTWRCLVERAQFLLAQHLHSNATPDDTIKQLTLLLDGPEQRVVEKLESAKASATEFEIVWDLFVDHTYAINVEKGFFKPGVPCDLGMQFALIHSEVSEAVEGHRKDMMDDKLPNRKMLEVELADAVIRIMNLGRHLGLDIPGAIVEKTEFNSSRPYMHGGKKY